MKILILLIVRLMTKILRLLGRGGSLPGSIALKLYPQIVKEIIFPQRVIMITGTNGKSSITNYLYYCLKDQYCCLANLRGDNLIDGWLTLILNNCDFNLKVNADILILEADEHYLAKYLAIFKVSDVIISNLFRDQLDRSFELDLIVNKFYQAFEKNPQLNLYLNADDPLENKFLNLTCNKIYYHLEKNYLSSLNNLEVKDAKFCQNCYRELKYQYYQYSHLGAYYCDNCNFYPQKINYRFHLTKDKLTVNQSSYSCSVNKLYTIYNMIAAYSLLANLNLSLSNFESMINNFTVDNGRDEKFNFKNKMVKVNLVKNPVGFNEVLKSIKLNSTKYSLLIVLNDNSRDGRDISWIYNVNFNYLTKDTTIVCAGKRALELAICLRNFGFDNLLIANDLKTAVENLLNLDYDLYALSTYTTLQSLRKELQKWK